jgi:hypothetical protein
MNVMWSATTPETGRFFPADVLTDFKDLEDRYRALRSLGQGYLEIRLSTDDSPLVAVSFRGDHAVVQQLTDSEEPKSFLLVGDGSLAPDGTVDVPFMDDDAGFTGDFVMSPDRAWDAVREFVRIGSVGGMGEWYEL